MNGEDLFRTGFGARRQQPFTFDDEDMNPFADASSPWNDVPATTSTTSQTEAAAPEPLDSDAEGEHDSSSDDASRLHQDAADKLHIDTDNVSKEATTPERAIQAAELRGEEDEMRKPPPETQPGKADLGDPKTPPVQSARRVGVIKRGLRSPRVLGKQLSPASFEDPLSSAAANNSDTMDPLNASVQTSRASVDISSPSQHLQAAVSYGRQTRSMSEARTSAGTVDLASVPTIKRPPASSPPRQQQQTEHVHPHPYDQQLSPPLQHEQVVQARQHVEGDTARQSTASRRPSISSVQSRGSTIPRAYLGAQQRRRSLEPTPADQMPHFYIQVTDPVKVSESLKSFIAYKIRTRSDAPIFRESEMSVRRRYRDFDWLVQELVARHPGVVVPAIPEKQSMGRFGEGFVEGRRAGLESSLARISRHPILWKDDVFRLFLEAEDFPTKARAITETRVAAEINGTAPLLSGGGAASSGLFGEGWGGAKYKEKDEWFSRRMQELDAIEEELRALLRALEYSQRQRRELSIAHGELGEAYLKMAGQELSRGLANGLTDMGSLQQRLRELQNKQGVADFAAFQLTTEEYIRMIGAVRMAFAARGRAHMQWQGNLGELIKRRKVLEGYVQHPGRVSAERMAQLKGEIARAEMRTEASRNAFDDVSQILKQELVRFDSGRVRDFQAAIESYLTSLVDTQEEIVVLWESYLASLRSAEATHSGQSNS